MNLLGREIKMNQIPQKVLESIKMLNNIKQFKSQSMLLKSYLNKKSPNPNYYVLRSGKKIFLSRNPHDSLTVMVIFCRKEYGDIPNNSTIVDIGANIGVFSLYAALNGAKKVYAFEPNKDAFEVLCKNIIENELQDVIIPYNLAVSGKDGEKLLIPSSSSPYNKISIASSIKDAHDEIETISLNSIIRLIEKEKIDLCKIDCEGAEYDILYSTPNHIFNNIEQIRMEHHDATEKNHLVDFLKNKKFKWIHDQNMIMWFEK